MPEPTTTDDPYDCARGLCAHATTSECVDCIRAEDRGGTIAWMLGYRHALDDRTRSLHRDIADRDIMIARLSAGSSYDVLADLERTIEANVARIKRAEAENERLQRDFARRSEDEQEQRRAIGVENWRLNAQVLQLEAELNRGKVDHD